MRTASITLDSDKIHPAKMIAIEKFLYGTKDRQPCLPSPVLILALVGSSLELPLDSGDTDGSEDELVIDGGSPDDTDGGAVDGRTPFTNYLYQFDPDYNFEYTQPQARGYGQLPYGEGPYGG